MLLACRMRDENMKNTAVKQDEQQKDGDNTKQP